jgi:hypothetical protein
MGHVVTHDAAWVRQQVNKLRSELHGDAAYRPLEQRLAGLNTPDATKKGLSGDVDTNHTRTLDEYYTQRRKWHGGAILNMPTPTITQTATLSNDGHSRKEDDDEMLDVMAKYRAKKAGRC